MFSSYKHKESRLLSFKNGGGEKMGGEEREGGGSGEVSVEDGMLVKLEEMLKGVEGEDREVLEEVITEAFSGDEEALESAEEELGKLGEEVKEWMGADLSLEKVVVVGRLLGVEVSEEALSFVEGEGEGEVKEGDVETVGSGEEVKRWVEEVEAVEGVSVRVEGTVVVIEGGKKVMRVDGGKLRKLQLQGAVRSLVQRARLEKNIGEIEGERGLEGVEFSVVDTTKVKVVYGGVEQVVNLVNVENRWVRQMAVLRVVGRGVRERGEEKMKETVHTTKGGVELSIEGLSAADLLVLQNAEKPEEEGGMGLELIYSGEVVPNNFSFHSIAFRKQGEVGAFVNAVDTYEKKGESGEERDKRFTKDVVAMLKDVKKNMENKEYNPLVNTLKETVAKLTLKEGTTVKLGKTFNDRILNVPASQYVVIQAKGKEAVTYEVLHSRRSNDGVIRDNYVLIHPKEGNISGPLPNTKENLLRDLQAEVKKLEGESTTEKEPEAMDKEEVLKAIEGMTSVEGKNLALLGRYVKRLNSFGGNQTMHIKLPNIKSISAEVAQHLEDINHYCYILLDGLTSLNNATTAGKLALAAGPSLSLNGLTTINEKVAAALVAPGTPKTLHLNGLTSIPVALQNFKGDQLYINGAKKITTAEAEALGKIGHNSDRAFASDLELRLQGLTDISSEAAEKLANFSGEELHLQGITKLDAATAKALARFASSKKHSTTKQKHLFLSGVTSITPDVAKELAAFNDGFLRLGITSIDAAIAKALKPASSKGIAELHLNAVTKLDAATAEALSATNILRLSILAVTNDQVDDATVQALANIAMVSTKDSALNSRIREARREMREGNEENETANLDNQLNLLSHFAGIEQNIWLSIDLLMEKGIQLNEVEINALSSKLQILDSYYSVLSKMISKYENNAHFKDMRYKTMIHGKLADSPHTYGKLILGKKKLYEDHKKKLTTFLSMQLAMLQTLPFTTAPERKKDDDIRVQFMFKKIDGFISWLKSE